MYVSSNAYVVALIASCIIFSLLGAVPAPAKTLPDMFVSEGVTLSLNSTLKIFCPRNQLLIMFFACLHNLSCSFLKSTALISGIGPLLMLHVFYGSRCH